MSRNRRRKCKKGCSCSGALVTALVLILIVCVITFTDVLTVLRQKIEMQIYPLNYREEILRAAEEYDLEPEYICAVIHTESKFNSKAESVAGAQGLMQIMPETFMWIAELKDEDTEPEDVFIPEISIDYGCYYLRRLANHYGDCYTASAAYNAGSIVNEWLSDPLYSTDGVTLSSIPFEETNEYIERIRHAEQMYQKLYFDEY